MAVGVFERITRCLTAIYIVFNTDNHRIVLAVNLNPVAIRMLMDNMLSRPKDRVPVCVIAQAGHGRPIAHLLRRVHDHLVRNIQISRKDDRRNE